MGAKAPILYLPSCNMLHQSLQTEKAFECPPINDWTLLTVTHFLVCAQTLLESQFRRKARKRGMKIG